jgi:hypothetical protein
VILLSGVLLLVGVVGAIAGILGLSALAERWLPADELPPPIETHERPLVRIIKPEDRRHRAA